ncbi:hypothetical protein L479_01007 [Exiguobacterium sp. S17]|nr:hypothetical protein L479_01007 [Exiguobacterium sp. S17]
MRRIGGTLGEGWAGHHHREQNRARLQSARLHLPNARHCLHHV